MIEKMLRAYLRRVVAAYARATGESVMKVSRDVYGNGVFLGEFVAGRATMSIAKFDAVLGAISSRWPDDVPWPEADFRGVCRPAARRSAKVIRRRQSPEKITA